MIKTDLVDLYWYLFNGGKIVSQFNRESGIKIYIVINDGLPTLTSFLLDEQGIFMDGYGVSNKKNW